METNPAQSRALTEESVVLRFVVIGISLDTNELVLNHRGRVIRFKPILPAFHYRLGEVIRIKGAV